MILSNKIRNTIIQISSNSKEGHIPSSFSIVELLLSIFQKEKIRDNFFDPTCIVLSKGHATYAYYAFLYHIGLMDESDIDTIGQIGSKYYGHLPFIKNDKRFQFGSGSLGHGLPFAIGLAHGLKILNKPNLIYCIVGDGELNEGTFWESLLLLQKLKIKNIKILIDCNGSSERAIPIIDTLNNLEDSFKSLDFVKSDGHSIDNLISAMKSENRSQVILCETIKGYPVSFMMDSFAWHHRVPNEKEILQIQEELN